MQRHKGVVSSLDQTTNYLHLSIKSANHDDKGFLEK